MDDATLRARAESLLARIAAVDAQLRCYVAVDQAGKSLLEGFTTVTFAEHGGKTKLTVATRAVGLVDYAARMLDSMEEGWTQSLERLAAHAARVHGKAG